MCDKENNVIISYIERIAELYRIKSKKQNTKDPYFREKFKHNYNVLKNLLDGIKEELKK